MEANRWTICLGLTAIKCSFHPFVEQSFFFKVEVSKSKPIQNKTANRSKKMKTTNKPNIFGCVRMLFCINRYDRIGFRITFSKPNEAAKVNINTYLLFH